MQEKSLIVAIADTLQQIRTCEADPERWSGALRKAYAKMEILAKALPSGSGVDGGTQIVEDECKPGKVVLSLSYHHMNDAGYYDGWTHHKIIVTPTFDGIDLRITGRDRNEIKDYLHIVYDSALRAPAPMIDWQTL